MQKEFWGTPKWIAFGWFFVPLFSVLFSFFCLLLFEFPSPFRCLPFQQFLNTHVVVLRRRYSKIRSRVFLNVFFSSFFKVAVWKNERDVEHSPVFFSPSTTFLYQFSSLFGVFVCAVFFFSNTYSTQKEEEGRTGGRILLLLLHNFFFYLWDGSSWFASNTTKLVAAWQNLFVWR